jgi:hypothetical protein
LHQGSVCGVGVPGDFPARLAAALAEEVEEFPTERVPVEAVRGLVENRYGSESWLKKR